MGEGEGWEQEVEGEVLLGVLPSSLGSSVVSVPKFVEREVVRRCSGTAGDLRVVRKTEDVGAEIESELPRGSGFSQKGQGPLSSGITGS